MLAVLLKTYDSTAFRPSSRLLLYPGWDLYSHTNTCSLALCWGMFFELKLFMAYERVCSHGSMLPYFLLPGKSYVVHVASKYSPPSYARALRPPPRRTFVQPERRAQYKVAARRSGRRTFWLWVHNFAWTGLWDTVSICDSDTVWNVGRECPRLMWICFLKTRFTCVKFNSQCQWKCYELYP